MELRPQTHYISEVGCTLLRLLFLPPKCWDSVRVSYCAQLRVLHENAKHYCKFERF